MVAKKSKCKCPKCNRVVKKYHHLASYADRLCAKCLDKHINKVGNFKPIKEDDDE
jgi:hypothetical protein